MTTTTRFADADGNAVTPGEYAIIDTRVHVTAVARPNGFTIDQQDATIIHTVVPVGDAEATASNNTERQPLVTDEQVAAAVTQAYRDGASQENGSWQPPASASIRDYPDRDALHAADNEAEQINHAAMRRILEAATRTTTAPANGKGPEEASTPATSDALRDAIEDLINDAGHIEHTPYDDGARTGAVGHQPGSDLYCPACWVHGLRSALDTTRPAAAERNRS